MGFFKSISYPLWNKLPNRIKNRALDLHRINFCFCTWFETMALLWKLDCLQGLTNKMWDLGDIQLSGGGVDGGAGGGLKVYKFSQCGWSLLFLNAIGGENVEKGQFDRPPTIRYRRVFYVAKRLIFNKEHLLILLCKIKSITLCKICRMSRGGEEVT